MLHVEAYNKWQVKVKFQYPGAFGKLEQTILTIVFET